MFGIGVGELFVIFIIAVVVIGPQRLPEVARTIGKLVATAKRTTNQLRDQMHEEVRKFEDMEEIKEFKSVVQSELYNMQETTKDYVQQEIEQEEKRLEEEAHKMEQALTAEGGPAPATEPSIAPPADAPAADTPAADGPAPEALADNADAASGALASGETASPLPPAAAAASSGGNGNTPGRAQPGRPTLPPESSSDKPVT